MALVLRPGTGFPFTIAVAEESLLGAGHTWDSVADWCTMLIGPMSQWWILDWDDARGMVWGFTRKEDAMLFALAWHPDGAKKLQKKALTRTGS